jgi:RNA polymerase sigma-70 factor (ECF subfamily)
MTFRRKDRSKVTSSLDGVIIPSRTNDGSDESELLFRAIKLLNDVDKTIITLHLDDYSNEEISEITGLTKNNVAVKLHRIKSQLTKQLNPEENGSAQSGVEKYSA